MSMILIDIIEEQLEEADFLCQQRGNALGDRVYDLGRLADLEERLLAHLDGLLFAEPDAWDLLKLKLTKGERGEAFAAAFVAFATGETGYRNELTAALDQAEGPALEGITEALRHSPSSDAEPTLRSRLAAAKPCVRSIALDVLSFRRAAIDAKQLELSLLDNDPAVVVAAVTAVGRLRIRPLVSRVDGLLGSDNPHVRRAAMTAALVVGSEKALAHCRAVIKTKGEEVTDALTLIGVAGQAEDIGLLVETLNQSELARSAASALGWLGYASTVDALIPLVADPNLSRLAGEAIARITGLNLEKDHLVATTPPPPTSTTATLSTTLAADDDDVVEDPDEGLPWPDQGRLMYWWKTNAARFAATTRYRNGKPYSQQVLIDILHNGPLPDRHHAAYELALLEPSSSLLETYAFADRQRRELAQLGA